MFYRQVKLRELGKLAVAVGLLKSLEDHASLIGASVVVEGPLRRCDSYLIVGSPELPFRREEVADRVEDRARLALL